MKVFSTIMKVLAALAAVAGAVWVVATYGDKIVAWAKGLYEKYGCRTQVYYCDEDDDSPFEEPQATEETPAEEAAAEPEAPAADAADDADFEN